MTDTLNVTLTAELQDFVRRRIAEAEFPSASDYVRHLIRADRKRAAQDALERLLLEGVRSGPPQAWNARAIDEIRGGRAGRKRRRSGRTPA